MHQDILTITVFGSSACNLNCNYCFLHKNKAYSSYNTLIKQAWQSGEYVKNIEKTLHKMKADPLKIHQFEIWGGESLLGIDDITKQLPNIYNLLPNLNQYLLSTNFTINIDSLINFIVAIDKIADRDTAFKLQFSIDGPPGEISDIGHNGWDYYEKNIEKLTNFFNNYQLKYVKLNMLIHPTIDIKHYLKFTDYNYLKYYMEYMYNFSKLIRSKCISRSMYFTQTLLYPNLATPYEFTTEDGRNFAKVFEVWDQVYNDIFQGEEELINEGFYNGCGLFSWIQKMDEPNKQCRELRHALTINYDGSIAECSGSFITTYEPYLKELQEKDEKEFYLIAKAHNNMTNYQPLELSDEEIIKKNWYIHQGGYRETKSTYLASTIRAANALAHAGQILDKYKNNYDLLLKHCSLILNCTSCSRNNIAETYMPYVLPIGALRLFLNGAADYMYDHIYNNPLMIEIARSKRDYDPK